MKVFTQILLKGTKRNIWKIHSFTESFENKLLNVLQRHAPLKAKVVTVNHARYVNRILRKAIKIRSELERKDLKNGTNENRIRYKK